MSHLPSPPSTEAVLRVLASLERHPADSPASLAFRAALRRMGREIDGAGGLPALNDLMAEVASADSARSEARLAAMRAAWAGLLPGVPRWSAQDLEPTGG